MPITAMTEDEIEVLVLSGDLATEGAKNFHEHLLAIEGRDVVLDFSSDVAMDTAHLQLVCAANRAWVKQGRKLMFRNLRAEIQDAMQISGFSFG